ncbi:MAG: hypothetical protein IJT45_02140 [Bacteroidales bacterium]|nr:hypothetical protein [Bacteroidales bacterium]
MKSLIYKGLYDCFYYNSYLQEAGECIQKADELADDNIVIKNALKQYQARVYCENAEYDSAMIIYRELLKTPINTDVYDCELGIAKCFLCANETDSAVFYYEKSLDGNKSVALSAVSELVEICEESADTTMCLKYSYLYYSLSHSFHGNIYENSKITILYDEFKKQQQADNQNKTRKIKLIVSMLLLFFFTGLSIYYIIRYKKRKEKEIDAIRKNTEKKISDISKSIEIHRNIVAKARKRAEGITFSKRLNDFENQEICMSLKNRLLQHDVSRKTIVDCYDCALNNRETALLTNTANSCFPDFSTLLVEDLGVKGENITYCCLSLLGFSIIEIAVLMKISYQAAHKRVAVIKEILKTDNDVKDFLVGYLGDIYD